MRFPVLLYSFLLFSIPVCDAYSSATQTVDPAVNAAQQKFDYDMALKTSQDAIDNQLGNYAFTNAEGKQITLSDLRGKPLVVSMIYTSCYQICPMTTRHLSKVVEKARDTLGADSFSVAVIGFDTQFDTPQAMQYFANKQGISESGWNLLSIDKEDIGALSKELGFIYFPSSAGFDHLIQATIVDADGKVYRQVYGQVFNTPLLVDPLIELVLGRPQPAQSFLSSLTSKVKLFCTTYDPVRDGYYFDYSLFLGMLIGGSIIIYTGVFIRRELRKGRKHTDV
jgi:protein SCO1